MYRIYLYYFAAEGILYPFWPTWLRSLGYRNSDIGLFIAAAYWPQVLVGFSLAYLADWRFGQMRLAAAAALLATLCMLLFYLPHHVGLYLLLTILYGGLWTAVLPLGESYLLELDKQALHDYGLIRAAGSMAFVLASIGAGSLLERFGQGLVPGLVAACMLLTAKTCFSVAAQRRVSGSVCPVAKRPAPDWRQLRNAPLLLALAAAGLIQLSHCLYFSTASNMWSAAGYSPPLIGAFWAVAVIAEISYFALSARVMRSIAPLQVIVLSGLCAVLRWLLAALGGGLVSILAGQLLHAASFAAYHSALMRYLRDHSPEGVRTLIQGLYYSLAVALPMGIVTPLAGWLFDISPSRAYLCMALIALGGTVTAYLANQRTGAKDDARAVLRRPF
ncbi:MULTISPECIES: MFS transporter [Sorangium]|uniref:Major facilitator superfamily transporter n=1 Tax=Sorangium cellulosum TaxID=56 RepID=A0A4P2QF89_SORCE|nr:MULTISPECIES: MFS transporter [Sorangium]AUX28098.1 major facilitator superfamily transporter [Sorangium cellulosum]WCQ87502.1 putative 3-phenylpropionic acid transporter [Sorangium sp. Soce836]